MFGKKRKEKKCSPPTYKDVVRQDTSNTTLMFGLRLFVNTEHSIYLRNHGQFEFKEF